MSTSSWQQGNTDLIETTLRQKVMVWQLFWCSKQATNSIKRRKCFEEQQSFGRESKQSQ